LQYYMRGFVGGASREYKIIYIMLLKKYDKVFLERLHVT